MFQENDLVMIRCATRFGYSNTWWRVMFIDNDGSFIGRLERYHWKEYEDHKKDDTKRFDYEDVKRVFKDGEQFCYSDKLTICECHGLCKEK